MLYLDEYRQRPEELSDLLPWAFLKAPGIVQCKDSSFLKTIVYRGPDLDSSTKAELIAMSAQVNNALKRLSDGWAIYAEAQRIEAKPYKRVGWPNKIAQVVEDERAKKFSSIGSYFETHFYLTFQFIQPRDTVKRLEGLIIEDDREIHSFDELSYLEYFNAEVDKIVDLLNHIWPVARILDDDELLTYLHSTVSTKRYPVKTPDVAMYLDVMLTDEHFEPGLLPRLGDHYIQCISLKNFPGKAIPSMLDRLDRLGLDYRCVNRFVYLDKPQAEREIKKYMRRWFSNRKSTWTAMKERMFGTPSEMIDEDAQDKGEDAKAALQIAKQEVTAFGYYTFTVVLTDKDRSSLVGKTRAVEQVINGLGFTALTETVNNTEAWLGTVPGNAAANVRKPVLSVLQLARLIPTSAIWSGSARNEHLQSDALFQALTDGNTPFHFNAHVGDVGHALLVGPTGAGKSTLLSFSALSFLRYQDARIVFFDIKRGSRATTLLMGGKFYELSNEQKGLRLQPLSDIDNLAERAWAAEWIQTILAQENVTITAVKKSEIWKALESLALSPRSHRTITGFCLLVQDAEIRQALSPYAEGGAYGHIFDGDKNEIAKATWLSFEMADLLESKNALMPAQSYLFHMVEQRLDGKPTLVFCDETWMLLEKAATQVKKWLKTFRSKNAAVVFATQSLDDLLSSEIFPTINDNVLSRIFLPNSKALDDNTSKIYRAFGLNDTQLKLLATATPKQDYYLTSEAGNRLFQLGLDPLALTVVGSSSTMDQKLMDRIIESDEYFPAAFLDAKGHHELADALKKPVSLEKEIA